MMKSKKQTLAENLLRQYIRKEIKRVMEADEEGGEPTATASTEKPAPKPTPKPEEKPKEAPEEAPEETPEEEPEEEEGLNPDFQAAYNSFIAKLKGSTGSVTSEDVVEMASNFINNFTGSSEEKLNVLKTIKSNIVR